MRVVVTRIQQDGTMQRRVVDTAQTDDCLHWERLAARALEFPPPYRPVPGIPVYHVSVADQVILVAEHDLGGPLLNLVTAVLALGEELLARSAGHRVGRATFVPECACIEGHEQALRGRKEA